MKVSSIVKMPILRKVAASAMMMTTVLGGASVVNAKPSNNNKTINQTEVVSSEGAKALASQIIQGPTITKERFTILDNRMMQLYTSESEKAQLKEIIDETYNKQGTFLTTVWGQHSLFNEYFNERVLKDNTKIQKYYNKYVSNLKADAQACRETGNNWQELGDIEQKNYWYEKAKKIENGIYDYNTCLKKVNAFSKYLDEQYEPWFFAHIQSSIEEGKLSFADWDKKLDDLVAANDGDWADKSEYDKAIFIYTKVVPDLNNTKEKARFIAYKVFLLDKMFYTHMAEKFGLFNLLIRESYENKNSALKEAYSNCNPLDYE